MNYPRSYVGELTWEWLDDAVTEADLFIEATPYDLLDPDRSMNRYGELPDEVRDELLHWVEAKAHWLLALAQAAPPVVGAHCPFCAYVLPSGASLNALLAHIAENHPQEQMHSVVMGQQIELVTQNDAYPLLSAEEEQTL